VAEEAALVVAGPVPPVVVAGLIVVLAVLAVLGLAAHGLVAELAGLAEVWPR
jgi:hypothetical protein